MSKTRVQLDFDEDAYGQVQELKDRTGARTNAELIRNALSLYDWALARTEAGWKIQVTKGSETVQLEVLGLRRRSRIAAASSGEG